MSEMNEIVKLAVDAYHGKVQKYSVEQSMDLLRQAMIEANGGSTTMNYRNMRDGKCAGLFTLVEEVLARTVVEGLQGDEYFNALVEFRNIAEGDKNIFTIEDSNMFVVAEAADGTQGIRRQRLSGTQEISIPTKLYLVKIYEELNRVLSNRVDFNALIEKTAASFKAKVLEEINILWEGASATDFGGATYFPVAGTYDEDALLEVISHVEAAAGGKTATIIGPKKALRNLKPSIQGVDAQSDLYNKGYYGKFYGNPVVMCTQRHKVGSTEFTMNDNMITIVAGEDLPIKFVYEGDPIIMVGDPMSNADLTQEYMYGEKFGMAIVLAGGNTGIGRYEVTTT